MPLHPFEGVLPTVAPDAFVAPGAQLIGDVVIGAESSVWYNCVLRGDVNCIRVGARTNIQDGTVIHVASRGQGTFIGDDVLIGHMAMVHACTLENHAYVGLGSIVMDGCVVETDAMLAAGAMLTPGKRVPSGELWAGRPATFKRRLSPEEIAAHRAMTAFYVEVARRHRTSLGC